MKTNQGGRLPTRSNQHSIGHSLGRLAYIDNLRILLMILVMLVHLAITYGGPGGWFYKEVKHPDAATFVVLSIYNAGSQAFFMAFFFLIAGYFTAASYDRKGPKVFLRDRLIRLGIPLLVYDWLLNPLTVYYNLRLTGEYKNNFGEFATTYYAQFHVGSGPLWFVESLLIFSFIYVALRLVTRDRFKLVGPKLPGNLKIIAFAVGVGLVSFIVRIWIPILWCWELLNLQLPYFTQYICAFIVGIAAYRGDWLTKLPASSGWPWLAIGCVLILVGFPVLMWLGGAISGDISALVGGLHWQAFALSLCFELICVAMITGLTALFREKLNFQNRLTAAMSGGVYTVYVIQTPVLIFVCIAMRDIQLYPLLKFAIAGLVTIPACFIIAAVIRTLPLARRVL
jgi:fucose 4-O-acetylase-like acetyltransferase